MFVLRSLQKCTLKQKGQKHDFVHGGNIHYCIAAEGRGYVHTRPLTETSLSHPSNMVRSDWPSGSGSLNPQSSLLNIYFRLSIDSSPLFYLSISLTVQVPFRATPKCGTEPIRYVTLHF